MYGYVVVNKPDGQISISYDMTFLLVLLTGLYEPDTTYKEARCIAHPVHKHPVRRNKITTYVADMNVLMTYYKCVDDWQDDRKLMKKLLASSLTNKVKRIEKAYSQKARIIKAALDRMSELENNNESNIDLLAEQFGIIMAQILCMKNDEWYDTLKVMGNSLGRFIYILDAYDDLLEDKKKGRYNALRTYENNKDFDIFIENVLKSHMAQFAAGFESLPIIENVDLLRNVIYSGVFTRFGIAKNKREQVEEV